MQISYYILENTQYQSYRKVSVSLEIYFVVNFNLDVYQINEIFPCFDNKILVFLIVILT